MATSYSNLYGSGDRTGIMTITTNISLSGNVYSFINGSYANGENYFVDNFGSVVGKYFRFDFNEPYCIDEITWRQEYSKSEGEWKVQGSMDDSTWVDLSSNFVLGNPETTIVNMSNIRGYRYYRIIGVNGVYYYNPWLYEIEFKIGPQYYKQYLFNVRNRFVRTPISYGI